MICTAPLSREIAAKSRDLRSVYPWRRSGVHLGVSHVPLAKAFYGLRLGAGTATAKAESIIDCRFQQVCAQDFTSPDTEVEIPVEDVHRSIARGDGEMVTVSLMTAPEGRVHDRQGVMTGNKGAIGAVQYIHCGGVHGVAGKWDQRAFLLSSPADGQARINVHEPRHAQCELHTGTCEVRDD